MGSRTLDYYSCNLEILAIKHILQTKINIWEIETTVNDRGKFIFDEIYGRNYKNRLESSSIVMHVLKMARSLPCFLVSWEFRNFSWLIWNII